MNKNNKIGRPTKYKKDFCNKVDDYLKKCVDIRNKKILKVNLPTLEGFAGFIGVSRSTLFEWKTRHEDFSDSLDKILLKQKIRLINKGLSGEYNAAIVKLILSANHNMLEKNESKTEYHYRPYKDLTDEELMEELEELRIINKTN